VQALRSEQGDPFGLMGYEQTLFAQVVAPRQSSGSGVEGSVQTPSGTCRPQCSHCRHHRPAPVSSAISSAAASFTSTRTRSVDGDLAERDPALAPAQVV
jgi:hypothetical protein